MADLWFVDLARDALKEGYRVIAHHLNAVLQDKAPGVRIEADPMRPGDSLRHAADQFRAALPGMRTKRPLPSRNSEIRPWTLGCINSTNDPQQYVTVDDSDLGSGYDLAGTCEFLRTSRDRWTPDAWRECIKTPIESYLGEWLQFLSGFDTDTAGKPLGQPAPVNDWPHAVWDESFFKELDIRLLSLLGDLNNERPTAEVQLVAEDICSSVAAKGRTQERNKYLDSRWKSGWQSDRSLRIDAPLPQEFLGVDGAGYLSSVFEELVRLILDGKTDVIRSNIAADLRRLLGNYLSLRGFAVPLARQTTQSQPRASTKRKRSTSRDEAKEKLRAALLTYHKYPDAGLYLEPIGNNDLAETAKVSKGSASTFFKENFGGWEEYRAACHRAASDDAVLVRFRAALTALSGDFLPRHLLTTRMPGEDLRDEE